ncbi:death-associated protein 1 isoform X1 [Balaenoptera ricei]|uniref:death-associated protein 1 isoform X1 n=1 Tax=Balaenoptera ricei TaxID=2746895 RepID=UPI0028BECBF2|nr:death-associated protein 1 isoform X1 [Balaenoptera ricei]
MSSPPEGKLETKAGHPPAVKAGGMRIVQKHPHSGDTREEKDKDDQEWESPRFGESLCFRTRAQEQPWRIRIPLGGRVGPWKFFLSVRTSLVFLWLSWRLATLR